MRDRVGTKTPTFLYSFLRLAQRPLCPAPEILLRRVPTLLLTPPLHLRSFQCLSKHLKSHHRLSGRQQGGGTCRTVAMAVLSTLSEFFPSARTLKQIPSTAAMASCTTPTFTMYTPFE